MTKAFWKSWHTMLMVGNTQMAQSMLMDLLTRYLSLSFPNCKKTFGRRLHLATLIGNWGVKTRGLDLSNAFLDLFSLLHMMGNHEMQLLCRFFLYNLYTLSLSQWTHFSPFSRFVIVFRMPGISTVQLSSIHLIRHGILPFYSILTKSLVIGNFRGKKDRQWKLVNGSKEMSRVLMGSSATWDQPSNQPVKLVKNDPLTS